MVEIIWLSGQSGCTILRNRLHEEPMPDFMYTIGRKSANYPVPACRCNAVFANQYDYKVLRSWANVRPST